MRALIALALLAAGQGGWTAEDDHRAMLTRLGIAALRPGPSGDPAAPNAANTDEARANPHPDWPALLRTQDGRAVTSAAAWRRRRAELLALFEREVYGRVPARVPGVRWSAGATAAATLGGRGVRVQEVAGAVDNRAYSAVDVTIRALLVLPADARQRVPVLVMFAPPRWVRWDRDPRVADLIAAGWGAALLDPGSVQADSGAGLRAGIIGLVNRGAPRSPEDWGALRAWGWGASRLLDHLRTRAEVDGHAVGIEGVSRYGKAALVTAAFDERFAMALVGSAGEGGASPWRRNFGEALESVASSGEYHWMAGNFLRYAEAGGRTAKDLPVEAHQLIALVAPRLLFVSYGVPEKGDALWLDQRGSFMATVAAGPAWRLLGERDLGVGGDWRSAAMPPVGTGLLDGALAWRQHDGGHTDAPNMRTFIAWADRRLGRR
jgi:hypothetical protein